MIDMIAEQTRKQPNQSKDGGMLLVLGDQLWLDEKYKEV